jgi:hypothetical protein
MSFLKALRRKKSSTPSLTTDGMHAMSQVSSVTDRISKTHIEPDDGGDSVIIAIVSLTCYHSVAVHVPDLQ